MIKQHKNVSLDTAGKCVLAYWSGPNTEEEMDEQFNLVMSHSAAVKASVCLICVISATSPPPTDAQREAHRKWLDKVGSSLGALACVLAGMTPLACTAAKLALSGMAKSRRLQTMRPTEFFSDVDAAIGWATAHGYPLIAKSKLEELMKSRSQVTK